jgi:hypothetical protein
VNHRDLVFGQLLAVAHAGVEALRDEVGHLVVQDDLDPDVRVIGQNGRELRTPLPCGPGEAALACDCERCDRVGQVFTPHW